MRLRLSNYTTTTELRSSWAAQLPQRNMIPIFALLRRRTRSKKTLSAESKSTEFTSYITASPLLSSCGLSLSDVASNLSEWLAFGKHIAENLGIPVEFEEMTDAQKRRIFQYYLPVYFWLRGQLKAQSLPLCIGISAPQGCGKSTLCEQLVSLFTFEGKRAASISIDDFYLTNADQRVLASEHPGNRLLELRGNAGTHDIPLGAETLRQLKTAPKGTTIQLPRYDKSAYQGRGDRAEEGSWPSVVAPVDVILFEGWMLGFNAVDDEIAGKIDSHLLPVNTFLKGYKDGWDAHVDCWLVVKVKEPEYAFEWRLQAEQAMRAAGKPAMSDDQVADFVSRYMPAYKAYLPGLYARGPTTAESGRLLVVEVDKNREPAALQQSRPSLM